MMTRAEKEEQMSRAARWNEEQSAARTQPRPSQGGFWSSAIDRAANSRVVSMINEIGDSMNPFITIPRDFHRAKEAFDAGENREGLKATGMLVLDIATLLPADAIAVNGGRYLSEGIAVVGSKVGLFGGSTSTVGKVVKSVPNKISIKSFKPGEASAHFEKHGVELSEKLGFSSYTKEQYVLDANHVIQNGTFVPELNGYVMTPSGKGSALAPFVGLNRVTGEITTFHLKPVPFLEKKAPSLGWSAKPKTEFTDTIGPNRELGYSSPYRSSF